MSLTQEQIEEIKEQLIEQVQNLPEDKKSAALQQIESMSNETIESLVKQQRGGKKEKSIFRMIINKEIDIIDVGENNKALAVLDINPISKGHVIIIPKEAVKDSKSLPSLAFSLAKIISKNIITELKAKSTEIQTETKFGESIIHVIPIYDSPLSLVSPRQKSSMEEIKKIGDEIRIVKKIKLPKIKKQSAPSSSANIIQLKRHIP